MTAVISPNLGLFLGRPPIAVPERGLSAGNNFRVKEGRLSALNLGSTRIGTFQLNGPIRLIHNFFLRTGAQFLVVGTDDDLYSVDIDNDTVAFVTPVYATGTVDVSAANPAVVTANSGSPTWTTNEIAAGDQIHFGSANQTDPAATWYTVASVDSETQITLTGAVSGAPLTNSTYTIRKIFTGDADNEWECEVFVNASPGNEDLIFVTNGIDDIVKWNGTDDHASASTVNIKAKHIRVFNNMMIYGNVTQSGSQLTTTIINSDVGKPEDITNNLANQFVVHGGTDEIDTLQELGDNLVIYSGRTIVLAQFVGDPLVFIFRQASSGIGPVAGGLVVDRGDFHEFLGADAQYLFDGAALTEVNNHVWRDYLRQRDPSRIVQGFTHIDEENGDIIWAVPLTTDENSTIGSALVGHYLEDLGPRISLEPHSRRDFPFTASGYFERTSTLTWADITDTWDEINFRWNDVFFAAAFPLNLVGDKDGKLYSINTAQNLDGSALNAFVRFGRRPTGDGRMRGLISRVYPFITERPSTSYSLNVKLLVSDHAGGAGDFTDAESFDVDLQGNHFVSPFRVGRFFEVQFETTGASQPWELEGYDVDIRRGGMR